MKKQSDTPKNNMSIQESHKKNNPNNKKKNFRMGNKRGGNNLFFNLKMDLPY